MLALEIDEILPDPLDALEEEVIYKIKNSRCAHCGNIWGRGRMIMYVICSDKTVLWWHYTGQVLWRGKVIHKHPCEM